MPGNALIGYSGFVGATLARQSLFEHQFRSTNIDGISSAAFDAVYCSAVPAKKWIANKDPQGDLHNIQQLIARLETVSCDNFVLISTVDVFKNPIGVDENTPVDEEGLQAYGLNRRYLEKFVESHFKRSLIVRLPGLVGPRLSKNVIYDFLNDNNLQAIDSRGVFQFYPMVNLWWDIQLAIQAGLKLVHLTAEPVSVADVALEGFGKRFEQDLGGPAARYDMRTIHAGLYGAHGMHHQYGRRESLMAIRAYAQSEPTQAQLLEQRQGVPR